MSIIRWWRISSIKNTKPLGHHYFWKIIKISTTYPWSNYKIIYGEGEGILFYYHHNLHLHNFLLHNFHLHCCFLHMNLHHCYFPHLLHLKLKIDNFLYKLYNKYTSSQYSNIFFICIISIICCYICICSLDWSITTLHRTINCYRVSCKI